MPYKDRVAQRLYQLNWLKKRRQAWLAANGPCVSCGSADNLQVDHVDHTQKVSHRIWSWSDVRRNTELAKCQVLCLPCHKTKSSPQLREIGKATMRRLKRTAGGQFLPMEVA